MSVPPDLPSVEEITEYIELWQEYYSSLGLLITKVHTNNYETLLRSRDVKSVKKLFDKYIPSSYGKTFNPSKVKSEVSTVYYREGYHYSYDYEGVIIDIKHQVGFLEDYWKEIVKVGEVILYESSN